MKGRIETYAVASPAVERTVCSRGVFPGPALLLPEDLVRIESEAFAGTGAVSIRIQNNIQYIDSRAFADCSNLIAVWIPASVVTIAEDAFSNTTCAIWAPPGSVAEEYCRHHNNCVFVAVQ